MQDILTKNEARVLRSINIQEGSLLWELAAAAQLTPAEVLEAIEGLEGKGYLSQGDNKGLLRLTSEGIRVRQDISESSLSDPHLKLNQSYIVSPEESSETSYDEMSESDVSEALEAEIEKHDN